jgi:hypothetical protein
MPSKRLWNMPSPALPSMIQTTSAERRTAPAKAPKMPTRLERRMSAHRSEPLLAKYRSRPSPRSPFAGPFFPLFSDVIPRSSAYVYRREDLSALGCPRV